MAGNKIKEEINDLVEYVGEVCKTHKQCDKCMFSKFDGFEYYCIFDADNPTEWNKL